MTVRHEGSVVLFSITLSTILQPLKDLVICSCLQMAWAFGASDIIAVDVQDDKVQKAKIFGATYTVNAMKEDSVERIRSKNHASSLCICEEVRVRMEQRQFLQPIILRMETSLPSDANSGPSTPVEAQRSPHGSTCAATTSANDEINEEET